MSKKVRILKVHIILFDHKQQQFSGSIKDFLTLYINIVNQVI